MRLVLASLALATLAACGSVQYSAGLMDANAEVEAARAAGAAQTSPYELAGAEAYLQKARELEGRAEPERATKLAARSVELARQARANSAAASSRDAAPRGKGREATP